MVVRICENICNEAIHTQGNEIMLTIKDAVKFIGKKHDGFSYFINSNGNLNCTSEISGLTFYASESTNEWVTL